MGLFEKTGGTGTTTLDVPFNNQGGTVEATSGLISPAGGGTDTGGTYIAEDGATIDLSDGTEGNVSTYSGTYTGSGDGTINIGSGELEIGSGGRTFDFPAGLFQWSSGSLGLNFNTLTNTGAMTIDAGGGLTLLGSDDGFANTGGSLVNQGTINQSGSLTFCLNPQFDNGSSATYDFTGNGGIVPNDGTGSVTNTGLIEKTGGTGTTALGVPFDNQGGTVEAVSWLLARPAAVPTPAVPYRRTGATIDLSDGTEGNASTYSGTYARARALARSISAAASSRSAPAARPLTFLRAYSDGAAAASASTFQHVDQHRRIVRSMPGGLALLGSDDGFANTGVRWSTRGPSARPRADCLYGGEINNSSSATYDFTGDGGILAGDGAGTVINLGLFEKTGGTGTTTIGVGIPFSNQEGTVEATSGLLSPAGGGADTGGTYIARQGATIDLSDGTEDNVSRLLRHVCRLGPWHDQYRQRRARDRLRRRDV